MGMKKLAVIAALLAAGVSRLQAGPLPPVGCPTCIQNSAAPQNAQINIGTATIRGTLTVGTLSVTDLTITTLNATTINGNGAGITALNASNLASGTIASARVAGSYTGITGVGTIAAGTWQGSVVGTQYGGTGQNWSLTNAGSIPYFSAAGTMAALPSSTANRLLQTNGASAPSWTGTPTILGTNISAIPPANLAAGSLPTNVAVANGSIVTVAGTKVTGDIPGNAAGITGTLPLAQLGNGTLGAGVIAQTLTNTGVVAGTYAALPSRTVQLVINAQGRVTSATQVNIAIDPSQITAGSLPSGVTVPAAQVGAGNLASNVVAQTLNTTGVTAGTYGGATQAPQFTINDQGRVTSAAQFSIPGVSTRTAWIDQDNNWHGAAQTSQSSWTIKNDMSVTGALSVGSIVVGSPMPVASGGTGRATLTANAFLYGQGTSAVGLLPVLGNGGLIIGTGGAPSTGTLTGTANQVVVTNGAGAITLSLPQSIGTGSSPTFAGLTLSAPLTVPNGGTGATTVTSHGVVIGQGSSALSAMPAMGALGIVVGNTTSVDPSTAALAGTSNQVTVTRSASAVTFSLPQDINTGATPTFSGLTLTNALTVPNGGTGAQTLTNHGMLYGNGTGAVAGLPAMADGGLVIGAGVGVSPTTGTLAGTSNQVIVTRGGAGITLSLPQSIGTGNAPSFAGLTLSGALDMGSSLINNVLDPVSAQDSATKNYVDTNLAGLQYKAAARLGTTAALPANSYGNGSSGVGATLTGLSIGALTIDGATADAGDRVLIKDEGTASHNGIYRVTQNSGLVVYILTRVTDHDQPSEMGNGTVVFVDSGTTNLDTGWIQTSSVTTVGTSAVNFTQFNGLSGVTAGTGLVKSGNTISLDTPVIVGNGGTGAATLTTRGILYGNGTSAIQALPAMGALGLVVGNGTGVVPSTATLTGTTNRVTVTQSATAITLSGPQDIDTGASPTFAGLTLSSPLTVPNGGSGVATLTANGVVVGNGTGALFALPAMGAGGIITGSGTGVTPSTGTLTGTSNRVTVTQTGSNIVLSGPQDLGTGSSPTFVTVTAAVSGNATTATTATNIAGGAAGRIPMQTASGTTTLLPAMGAAGIIVGNGTSAVASTATLTGTANQVVVTQSATAVTLSLPQSINSGATPTFTGTNFTGIPESGVTNLTTDLAGKAATGANNDITSLAALTAGGLPDSSVYGQDIAASTITLNKLNQNGATSNQVIAWNGSAWVPTTPAAATTGLTLVSSGTFSSASSVSIPATLTATFYRLSVVWLQNTTTAKLCLRFNSDSGSNYRYGTEMITDNGAGTGSAASTADTFIRMSTYGQEAGLGGSITVDFRTSIEATQSRKVEAWWYGHIEENSRRSGMYGGGFYSGAADMSSTQLLPDGGTITGTWKLEATQ